MSERHHSHVIVEMEDELIVRIECNICGQIEFRAHRAHLGTLARTLMHVFATMEHDPKGKTEYLGESRGES